MLKVYETTDDGFDLLDALGERVGTIRGSALCFGGLTSEGDAIAAAIDGSRALATYLQRSFGASGEPPDEAAPIRLVHDGAYEWVARGTRPLARLLRPRTGRGADGPRDDWRVEFVLPSYVRAGALIGAAQQLHRAIASRAEPCDEPVGSAAEAPARGA